MNQAIWENYDLTRGEQIQQGYFAALEVVMRRFVSEMESFFFDQLKIHCEFDYSINSNRQFRQILADIPQPCPIFRFQFSPWRGESLLIMDNALANLFLQQKELVDTGRVLIQNEFQVTKQNFGPLERAAKTMLNAFAKSWRKLAPAEAQVTTLVANRLKAKVLAPTESTVMVKVGLRYKKFQSHWDFCFSAYELDPLLKKYGKKALLTGYCETEPRKEEKSHLEQSLLTQSCYQIQALAGELTLSPAQLKEALKQKTILPFKAYLNGDLVVHLNGQPQLSACLGETHGQLALQINGRYQVKKEQVKQKPVSFKPLNFPTS